MTSPSSSNGVPLCDEQQSRHSTRHRSPYPPQQTRFNVDTEIEPRLVITEVNMGPILEGARAYAAASVAVYVNVAFIGYNVLEEKYNEADTFSAIKSGG